MFKRYLAPNLIGIYKQHRIKLIVLLMLIAGIQNVHPQQQIALDTYAIFKRSCFNCHGPDGASGSGYVSKSKPCGVLGWTESAG